MLGRGKGSGGAGKSKESNNLHVFNCCCLLVAERMGQWWNANSAVRKGVERKAKDIDRRRCCPYCTVSLDTSKLLKYKSKDRQDRAYEAEHVT